jgi:uncharacterized protein (DUF302 family)
MGLCGVDSWFNVHSSIAANAGSSCRDPRTTALPCRISVFKTKAGKTRLSTIRPAHLLELYGSAGLKEVAAEVEEALTAIMNEAAH